MNKEFMDNVFKGIEEPHRLDIVNLIEGVLFVDDSKATKVNATWFAMESYKAPLIWITGGIESEETDYSILSELVKKKVKAIIVLPGDAPIHQMFRECPVILRAEDMADAVKLAFKVSSYGDTVLLSPGLSSFHSFDGYEDRGNQFKHAVLNHI